MVAKVIGLELDVRVVNLFDSEHMRPEFLSKNPQHTVPTLDDNGFIVSDSHAISTYLIEKYGKDDKLYPKDLRTRTLIDQRLHFDSGILFPRLRSISEGTIQQAKVDAFAQAYSFMDKFLAKDSFLVGNTVTVADLCCLATISPAQGVLPATSDKYPKLVAWMKRMESMPFYEVNAAGAKGIIELIAKKMAEQAKRLQKTSPGPGRMISAPGAECHLLRLHMGYKDFRL